MGDLIKLIVVLFVISTFAGLAIAFTSARTTPAIAAQLAAAKQEALKTVLPGCDRIEQRDGTAPLPETYWEGVRGETVVAWAFETAARGYSSDVKLMVSIDTAGTIMGLTVIEQGETPGLGSRTQESISDKYVWNGLFAAERKRPPWFSSQFAGLSTARPIVIDRSGGEWHRMDETRKRALTGANAVTAITGATISTRAVVACVEKKAAGWYQLLARPE